MVNIFDHFSLPQISTVARRTVLVASGVGIVALVIGVFAGYPLVGLGVCLGLSMALVNFRLISRATLKEVGWRPLLQGVFLWAIVAVASLYFIRIGLIAL